MDKRIIIGAVAGFIIGVLESFLLTEGASFGDSFTFGQDVIDGEHINPMAISQTGFKHHRLKANGVDGLIEMWKSECNEKSYTQIIADAFGFKNNLNFKKDHQK